MCLVSSYGVSMINQYKYRDETGHNIFLVNAKLLFLSIFIFSILPLVLADDLTIPFNENYDIKRPCFNNGTFCSSSATCNFTLIRPTGETIFSNQIMTFNSNFFNITLLKATNNQLGEHPAIMSCCENGLCDADTFKIIVTADGNPQQTFPTQFAVIFFAFLLVGFGTFFERLRLFKYMGSILLMVMGVLTLYPGYSLINYSNLVGQSIGSIIIGLGFYFLIEDSFSRGEQQEYYDQDEQGVYE